MPFLKRLGLGSSSSPSTNKKQQPNKSAARSLPTPSNSSSSSISSTQSSKRNSAGSSYSISSPSSPQISRMSTCPTGPSDDASVHLQHHHHHIKSSGSNSPNSVSASRPSTSVTKQPHMEFVEEIIDDYMFNDHYPHQHEMLLSQPLQQQQSPTQEPDAYILPALQFTVAPHNNDTKEHTQQEQERDHGHYRARSMPSLSTEEIQRLEPQHQSHGRSATDPSHNRSHHHSGSATIASPSLSTANLPHLRHRSSRRMTLNPGAALSTSALQSILQPDQQSSSSAREERNSKKRDRNKTVSMSFVNANKWASRGGIGQKNEMMVDLETSGVFVPETGGRLRPEFVYTITTQCADEIRARGLQHPNLFHNPAPKKVINSMISLLTDRRRCNLFSIKCMRIDTVVCLLLNTISRMSNPVIPYDMMDFFYGHRFTSVPTSPHQSSSSSPSSSSVTTPTEPSSSQQASSMATTPSSSPRSSSINPPSTSSSTSSRSPKHWQQSQLSHYQQTIPFTTTWARYYFDLPLFLDSLPAINRSILLEVLHLCQEVLEHTYENLLSVASLSQIISPALFSSVFDHKLLDRMAGIKRASIHGDGLSAMEGLKQECQMFTAILVKFLVMTTGASPSPSPAPSEAGGSPAMLAKRTSTATLMVSPMSSASTSTTSIPLPQHAVDPSSSATSLPSSQRRVGNRPSCPNLAGFPVPVSVATAKRTSMSPRPSVSEIRATKGIPLFRAEQESLRVEMQDYYQRMEQDFRELDIKRQSMPLVMAATQNHHAQQGKEHKDQQGAMPLHKDEITCRHFGYVPDSNGMAGQDTGSGLKHTLSMTPFTSKVAPAPAPLCPSAMGKPGEIMVSAPLPTALPTATV